MAKLYNEQEIQELLIEANLSDRDPLVIGRVKNLMTEWMRIIYQNEKDEAAIYPLTIKSFADIIEEWLKEDLLTG